MKLPLKERIGNAIMDGVTSAGEWIKDNYKVIYIVTSILLTIAFYVLLPFISKQPFQLDKGTIFSILAIPVLGFIVSWQLTLTIYLVLGIIYCIGFSIANPLESLLKMLYLIIALPFIVAFGLIFDCAGTISGY